MRFSELIESTIRLTDLYDRDELEDESEMLHNYVDDDDLVRDFEIKTLTAKQAAQLLSPMGDTTVLQAYKDHANDEQRQIVKHRMTQWDDTRVIVICNDSVIDGNHHLVAGIMSNREIKYISLSD